MVTGKNTELLSKVLGNAGRIHTISQLMLFFKSLRAAFVKLYEKCESAH